MFKMNEKYKVSKLINFKVFLFEDCKRTLAEPLIVLEPKVFAIPYYEFDMSGV